MRASAQVPTAKEIRRRFPDNYTSFHARRYVPGSVVVAAAGSVDHDQVVELAERTLGSRDAADPAPQPDPAPSELQSTVRFHRKDIEQWI